jgi:hypothetical protein
MVSIVIPKNSLSDLINAGLACRYYVSKGERVKLHLIDENKKEQFWTSVRQYVDKQDGSLLILNFPLSTEDELKHIDLEPYEYSILYIPGKSLAVTQENRKILFEKGIASVPPRDFWKCYPGNYDGEIERRWMEINRIVSLMEKPQTEDKLKMKIARGFLEAVETDPKMTVERIAKDDRGFFEKLGENDIPKFERVLFEPNFELISAKGRGSHLLQIAFSDALNHRKFPLGIKGEEKVIFLIDSPTFAEHVFSQRKMKYKYQMKFGENAAFCTDLLDDVHLGSLLEVLARKKVFLKFWKPELVARRTLSRRLVGGKGPDGRSYRGIKDEFPELEVRNNVITAPREALEAVFNTLKETRTKYEILE